MVKDLGLKLQTVRNFKFAADFSRDNIEFAINYKPLDTDKFVVTYPKSGTTWAQKITVYVL
jgi:hypothetical protein